MCFGGGGFLGLGCAPSPPPAPGIPTPPAPPAAPGAPGGGQFINMPYACAVKGIQGGFGTPTPGGANVGSANIMCYQQGLTPQTINQGLGMLQGVYNRAGNMGAQFMNNAKNAACGHYNPAIGAFNNATQANMMGVASALASQRGTAVNPGLAARNIGTMGANTQQQAVNQLGSLIGQYAMGQQQNALGAYGLQGNMGNAYAQAGLANQGQQLNAIAAQNAAAVAMQSNINSSNVAMQSNINNNNSALYGMNLNAANSLYNSGLQYNQGIYGDTLAYLGGTYGAQLGYLNNNNNLNANGTGGLLSGLGSAAGLLALGLNKGGQVPQRMARGGMVKHMGSGGEACGMGCDPLGIGNLDSFTGTFDVSPSGVMQQSSGPQSIMGQILQGMSSTKSSGSSVQQGGAQLGKGLGMMGVAMGGGCVASLMGGGAMMGGMAQGGRVFVPSFRPMVPAQHAPMQLQRPQRKAAGGGIQPQMGQQPGPMMPNLALAGSPNQRIAMPPTGLPMGNSQTRGGGPMPRMGSSGSGPFAQGGQVHRQPVFARPPMPIQGGVRPMFMPHQMRAMPVARPVAPVQLPMRAMPLRRG